MAGGWARQTSCLRVSSGASFLAPIPRKLCVLHCQRSLISLTAPSYRAAYSGASSKVQRRATTRGRGARAPFIFLSPVVPLGSRSACPEVARSFSTLQGVPCPFDLRTRFRRQRAACLSCHERSGAGSGLPR